jgi:hypothetical protein
MFADEARFGRMNRPRPCWAPVGVRPGFASQLIREYTYLYGGRPICTGAVCPKDGTCSFLIMPRSDMDCFQIFLDILAKRVSRQHILLFADGAPNHHCDDLEIPASITPHFLPPYAPELLCGLDIYVTPGPRSGVIEPISRLIVRQRVMASRWTRISVERHIPDSSEVPFRSSI